MYRREFVVGLCVGSSVVTGCIESESGNGPVTTNETTKQKRESQPSETTADVIGEIASDGVSVRLYLLEENVQIDDEIISSDVDCEEATVSIAGGYTPPNTCYDLKLDTLDERGDEVETSLTTEPNESKLDDGDCGVSTYRYRLVAEFDSGVPKTLDLRYDYRNDRRGESFSVENGSC